MWLIYVAILVFCIFLFDQWMIDERILELAEKFNGPRRWPVIGNISYFVGVKPEGKGISNQIPGSKSDFSKDLAYQKVKKL